MSGSIIVPLDGSPLAEKVLPLATSIAQRSGCSLLLLHVIPPANQVRALYGDGLSSVAHMDRLQREGRQYLKEARDRLVPAGIPATESIATGPVAESIVRMAERHAASYIIMSTRGHTGMSRWALGSVTSRVLHLAVHPLIVLPPASSSVDTLFAPRTLKRILVPLDGSYEAEQVLSHVSSLARLHGAEIWLFRAVSTVPLYIPAGEIGAVFPERPDVLEDSARDYLQQISSELELDGIRTHMEVGLAPEATAILDYAKQIRADLIAMTSHAREGLSRMILGSVTDRVIRAGEVPVLVTRAHPAANDGYEGSDN